MIQSVQRIVERISSVIGERPFSCGFLAGLAAARGLGLDPTMAIALTASASAPVAAMDTMFASKYGRDVDVSVGLVAVTTILSVATMPILVGISMWFFR